MEITQDRALAYNLAKELTPHDLDEVSGGAATLTHTETFRVTGNVSSPDGAGDVSIDW